MELVLLGTGGGGLLRPNRHRTAEVVIVGAEPLLFDCGEGATRQLQEAGIHPAEVGYLFFTHHHFDHNTDYPYFALTTWLMGRNRNLRVYGPPETAHITNLLFGRNGVFRQDQEARTALSGSQDIQRSRTGQELAWIEVDVTEIESSGSVCHTGRWSVTAAQTEHVQPYMDTLAYRVDSDEGSIAIAVDSAPTQAVIDLARGADILLHECSVTEEFRERFGLQRAHSGPKSAAQVAAEANVAKLVLVHILPDLDTPATLAEMTREVRRIFSGEVYMGEDLMRITV